MSEGKAGDPGVRRSFGSGWAPVFCVPSGLSQTVVVRVPADRSESAVHDSLSTIRQSPIGTGSTAVRQVTGRGGRVRGGRYGGTGRHGSGYWRSSAHSRHRRRRGKCPRCRDGGRRNGRRCDASLARVRISLKWPLQSARNGHPDPHLLPAAMVLPDRAARCRSPRGQRRVRRAGIDLPRRQPGQSQA